MADSDGRPNKKNEKIAGWFADGVEHVINEVRQGGFTAGKLRKRVEQFAERIGCATGTRIETKTIQEWLAHWLKTEGIAIAQTEIAIPDAASQERKWVVEFFKTTLTQVATAGGVEIKGGCSVAKFFEDWNAEVNKEASKLASGTRRRYAEVSRSFLDHLGHAKNRALETLTSEQIAGYRDSLRKKRKLSVTTVNLHLKIVKIAMRWAVDEKDLERSPARRVHFLPVTEADRQTRRAFTNDEMKRVYEAASPDWKGALLFAYYCGGLRLGDVVNLRWSNISLDGKKLTCVEEKTGKTKRLNLEKPLLKLLERIPAGDSPTQPLFPSLCTEKRSKSWLSNSFRKILVEIGLVRKRDHKKRAKGKAGPREISEVSFHSVRHTTRTHADRKAKNSRIVDELMGHTAEVGKRYSHYDEDDYSAILSQLPDIIKEIEEPGLDLK